MEIYELKYFLGVARFENIHRASERLNVSPASLSKAIGRLEAELGVSLFARERRNIRLTDQGRLLQRRAAEILQLEETARHEVAGTPGTIQIVITGPEILLAKQGTALSASLRKKFSTALFDFQPRAESHALEMIQRGEAHLAIVTGDIPTKPGFASKLLTEVKFQTYVGAKHPLYSKARRALAVEEVLAHGFVSPDSPLLGKVGAKQSLDGWRDDKFPRRVEFLTSSLKILEEVLVSGQAAAYLPEYFCAGLAVVPLKITGCPYNCVQKIKLVAFEPGRTSWLNQIF